MLSRDIFLLQRFLDDKQYKQSIWVPRNNAKYILLSFKFCIYFAWHQGQWGSKPGGVVKLRNETARELLNTIIHYHFGQTLNGESLKEIGRPPSFTSAWFSQTMTLNDIFKPLGIECVSSFSVSGVTFFHAMRSRLFSSFIVLGTSSLYVVSSMILQIFSMGLRSGEFAGQPSLAIKFGKSFWDHVWVAFEVWAGAPSCTNVMSAKQLPFYRAICHLTPWC